MGRFKKSNENYCLVSYQKFASNDWVFQKKTLHTKLFFKWLPNAPLVGKFIQ